jgi:hypothetical protein
MTAAERTQRNDIRLYTTNVSRETIHLRAACYARRLRRRRITCAAEGKA